MGAKIDKKRLYKFALLLFNYFKNKKIVVQLKKSVYLQINMPF
jgi:hypothetical protein